jgi:hypothetical protein
VHTSNVDGETEAKASQITDPQPKAWPPLVCSSCPKPAAPPSPTPQSNCLLEPLPSLGLHGLPTIAVTQSFDFPAGQDPVACLEIPI